MKKFADHIILPVSLLIYLGVWFLLQPVLGYILDSDGIAYLTIAERIAGSQYLESINGLWSPLNSWLLVPFIKHGYDAWYVSKLMNCFFGACVLILAHCLFLKFRLSKFVHVLCMLALPVVMVHHVYLQMYGDVLQLVFMLCYLLLLWSENNILSYWKTILCGILITVAFYAKAYSFFFFLVQFGVTLGWFYHTKKISLKTVISHYLTGCAVVVILILPWTFALHKKYGIWSLTGFSGKLNMSWQINSGKSFKKDITLLIPPSYPDSPSFWEDPYLSQENLSGPFSSVSHVLKWTARIIHTTFSFIQCFNEISFLALSVLLIAFYYFFFRKGQLSVEQDFHMQLLLLTALTLPAGYLLMHIETRYIWLETFFIMIAGAILLQRNLQSLQPVVYRISVFILAFSFIVFPMLDMKALRFKNKDLFEFAGTMKAHSIKGSFTSNGSDAGRMWVVAYLTKNPFYTIERSDYTIAELISEMKRYNVKYYLYQSENNKPDIRLDESHFSLLYKTDGFDLYEFR